MKKLNLIFLSLFACIATANAQIEGDDGFGQKPKTTTTNQGLGQNGKRLSVKTKNYILLAVVSRGTFVSAVKTHAEEPLMDKDYLVLVLSLIIRACLLRQNLVMI